jgi:tRNA(Ile)-lysidine synthase
MTDASLRTSVETIPHGRWGVGVSGGADSVALLLLLRANPTVHPHVIHLDHETRDGESAKDAEFVANLAARLRLSCTIARRSEVESPDSPVLSNVSSRYRKARFDLFRRTAVAEYLQGVILAHHADDQAETVLQRLLRGGGPGAIAGMRSPSVVDGLVVLRPLLHIPSVSLREMLLAVQQPWREDSSNQSEKYQRNRLRRWLVDRPTVRQTLLELGDRSSALRDWLTEATPVLPDRFSTENLSSLPAPLARQAATSWLIARGSLPDEINRQIADRLVEMATDAATPSRRHFPGNIDVRRQRGHIFV